jgi:hypothetical protein
MSNWELLYSMNKDGVSIGTFYDRCKDHRTTLLVIQDQNGWIFGGFCTEAWHPSSRFYGTGENFVYTFKTGNKPIIYRWTGETD